MTIGTMDIYLLVIIVSTLLVGFFWGLARSLMLLAGWLLAFVAGSYLQLQLGSYLANEWPEFVPSFSEMAAFGIIFVGLLVATPVFVVAATEGNQRIVRIQSVDDFLGAALATLVAILGIAGLMVVLATYYGTQGPVVDPEGGPAWTANLYEGLLNSNIGSTVADQVVPVLGSILGPILPPDVREVMT
jgi:uncharacterized membrane protein required for colicin V production